MIGADLVRSLRGRRSRPAFSKRLGYRSNVVHRWETGEVWPETARFLTRLSRIDPRARSALARFLGEEEPGPGPGVSRDEVARFLRELRGKTPIAALSRRTGYSRFRIGRWLSGSSSPRLPEFLCMVEAESRRLLDLLAELVDPLRMPTVAPRYRELLAARESAYDVPWSHAVLRALELRDAPRRHDPAWIARRLRVPVDEVERGLTQLLRGGQVRRVRQRYRPTRVQLVDTRVDPDRARGLKGHWARTAVERLEAGVDGSFGYSLFAVSRADLQRLRDLHMQYVRAMQTVIAESDAPQCVGLYCSQLLDLGEEPRERSG
ncbi:MAG: DUF4423 domain-containing protein [Myxococcales bacterium]